MTPTPQGPVHRPSVRRSSGLWRTVVAAAVATALATCGGGAQYASRPSGVPRATTSTSGATSTTGPNGSSTDGDLPGVASPLPDAELPVVPVATTAVAGLETPTALAPRPGTEDLYVAERSGTIRVVHVDATGRASVDPRPALDLTARTTTTGNRGLLGLVFSPTGEILYTSHTDLQGHSTVAAYTMVGQEADPSSRRTLVDLPMEHDDHNGGTLRFDRQGRLWFSLGDGGGIDDPARRAQDPADPRGKLLQLDPTGDAEPVVYARGLRNPWRFSFDRVTGDLWLADVGQETAEEINFVPDGTPAGVNFGWSGFEGSHLAVPGRVKGKTHAPIIEMFHDERWCAAIGGVVYRGEELPDLVGTYLYGDLCKQHVYALEQDDGKVTEQRMLSVPVDKLIAIEQDGHGEVWLLSYTQGLLRLGPA